MVTRKPTAKEGRQKTTASKADKPKKPTHVKQPALAEQSKPVKEKTSKTTPAKKTRKGKVMKVHKEKRFDHLVDEEDEEPQPTSELQVKDNEYNLKKRPSTQPQDDTSANVVNDTPSLIDVETGDEIEKSNSEGDTKILNVDEERGENVSNTVALEERTVELDEGQARSDPGNTLESRPSPDEDQAGSNPVQRHVALVGPNPEPMHEDFIDTVYLKNLDDALTFGDQFLNDKPTKEEPYPGNTLESRPSPDEDQAGSNPVQRHVALVGPNPEPMHEDFIDIVYLKNLDDTLTFGDQFLNDKPTKEEPCKSNVKTKVESMPINDVPIPDDVHISDLEDTSATYILKIKTIPEWLKHVPEEERSKTPKPEWAVPLNDLPETENNRANTIASAYKDLEENNQIDLVNLEGNLVVPDVRKSLPLGGPPELIPSLWIKSECEYDISAAYGISHWWFKRKEFYITRHSALSDRRVVRSHIKILSVMSLKTISRYGYSFLREIVLHRADYKEYKISKSDFKNLHPNDFEDLYLLHLQGNLNYFEDLQEIPTVTGDGLGGPRYIRGPPVFDGEFRGVGDEEVVVGEGVVVTSSSLEMLTNSCLGGIMVSLIFLEGLEEEALVELMVELFEEGKKKTLELMPLKTSRKCTKGLLLLVEEVVDGVVQAVAPTTAEQKLAKKNELKARGT
uniref:Uncharacterized protein n=1 Tax=Tanacetum cinerariifolium TaxID=118510 RepID=A0A6L2KJB8_TANCI|nr:hypothetical protein [Tanacetum cinerariifolium]